MTNLLDKLKRLEAVDVPLWADNHPDAESFRVYFHTPRGQYMSSCTDNILYENGPTWQDEWLLIGCIVDYMSKLKIESIFSPLGIYRTMDTPAVTILLDGETADFEAGTLLEATIDAALAALEG